MLYFDVLVKHANVSLAAEEMNITQPAMSNVLKRLRVLFHDSILVRTKNGMKPTEFALSIHPQIIQALANIEAAVQPQHEFLPEKCERLLRIMASDYCEATLIPEVLNRLNELAPNVAVDILTPSDVGFNDVEQGKVDMAINRYNKLPDSFYHSSIWYDNFSCVMHRDHPLNNNYCLDEYMKAKHIWVNKTGMGKGMGVQHSRNVQGRVDETLQEQGLYRTIQVYTRHYQTALTLAYERHLVATLPTKLVERSNLTLAKELVVKKVPFTLAPFQLSMIWSPLLNDNSEHKWFRKLIVDCAHDLDKRI